MIEKPKCFGNRDKNDIACNMCSLKFDCFRDMLTKLDEKNCPPCFGDRDEKNDICRICKFYGICKEKKQKKDKLSFYKIKKQESELDIIETFKKEINISFTAYDFDVLTEINQVCAHRVSATLSKMAGHEIVVTFAKVNIIRIEEIHNILLSMEKDSLAVLFKLFGGLFGGAIILFSKENMHNFVHLVILKSGIDKETIKNIEYENAIKEISNIIIGSYITVLEDTSSIEIKWGIPIINTELKTPILEIMLSEEMCGALEAPIIEIEFGDESKWLYTRFFVILKPESLRILLDKFTRQNI